MTSNKWRGCSNCKHLESNQSNYSCAAFPKGVPMPFLSGDLPHTEVIDGQVGLTVWELKIKI